MILHAAPSTAGALVRKLAILIGWGAVLTAGAAYAANPDRGEILFGATCRVCHGSNSHPGREVTRPAANRPDVIAAALRDVADMRDFAALYTYGDLEDIAAYLGRVFVIPPPDPQTVLAIEYHHAAFDHYFVTTIADEIDKLDRGVLAGWTRTGQSFRVAPGHLPDASATVCRFFSDSFAPKSSHFYTASESECGGVKANPQWTFEGNVFHVALPAADGACGAGRAAVFRLYNDGMGMAPNHRFTTHRGERDAMLARGWISEGHGPLGVAMCVTGSP